MVLITVHIIKLLCIPKYTMSAVSYTHLDVYKRQTQYNTNYICLQNHDTQTKQHPTRPVSYTHLVCVPLVGNHCSNPTRVILLVTEIALY